MPKTQMQLANCAWRIETKALGWHRGWKGCRKAWKVFCRDNAAVTVESREYHCDEQFKAHKDASLSVEEELTYWIDCIKTNSPNPVEADDQAMIDDSRRSREIYI